MFEFKITEFIFMSLFGGFVWLTKRAIGDVESKIKQVETDLRDVRENYLHKSDFKEFKTELRLMFEEIKADIKDLKSTQ